MNRKNFFLTVITLAMLVYTTSVFAQGRPVLDIVSGSEQVGVVNTDLANPLVVVLYKYNEKNELEPLVGEKIVFAVVTGGGYLLPEGTPTISVERITDAVGQTQVGYHLGTIAGAWEEKFLNNVVRATHTDEKGVSRTVDFRLGAVPDVPATINVASGNNQLGSILTILPETLMVVVKDQYGNPYASDASIGGALAPQATVQFNITTTTGAIGQGLPELTPVAFVVDDTGRAAVSCRLGDKVGAYEVTAQVTAPVPVVNDEKGNPCKFTETAKLPPYIPDVLLYVSGNNQVGLRGELLAAPFVVQVIDQIGVPVPNWTVWFTVTTGDGTLSLPTGVVGTVADGGKKLYVTSNATGNASANLKLGQNVAYQVTASTYRLSEQGYLDGIVTVTFNAAVNQIPTTLVYDSGDGQTGTVGAKLPGKLQVKVLDQNGVVMQGAKVNFSVTRPETGEVDRVAKERDIAQKYASLLPANPVVTDAAGIAAVDLTLSSLAGKDNHEVVVTADWWKGAPVIFTASANPDVPNDTTTDTEKTKLGDKQRGVVGSTLPDELTIVVKDQYGNAIKGEAVTFEVTPVVDPGFVDGTLLGKSTIDIETDVTGKAAVPFTLGTQARNDYKVTAKTKKNGNVDVTFTAEAFTGPGAKVAKNIAADPINPVVKGSNDEQIALIDKNPLPNPFTVKVTDKYGNPVKGWKVFFELVSPELATSPDGGPKLSATEVATDDKGLAITTLTLGTVRGGDTNRWKADGVEIDGVGQPVYYYYDLNGKKITDITPMAPDGKKDINGQKIPPGRNKVNAWILTGESMERIALDPDVDDSIDSMFTATGGGPDEIISKGINNQHGIVNNGWKCILKSKLTVELVYDYPQVAPTTHPVLIDWAVTQGGCLNDKESAAGCQSSLLNRRPTGNPGQDSIWLILEYVGPNPPLVFVTATAKIDQGFPGAGTQIATVTFTAMPEVGNIIAYDVPKAVVFDSSPDPGNPGADPDPLFQANNNVVGIVGQYLKNPLTILVRDRYENKMVGIPVAFSVSLGDGALSATSGDPNPVRTLPLLTNNEAVAAAYFKLGITAVTEPNRNPNDPAHVNNKVEATVGGMDYDVGPPLKETIPVTFKDIFWAVGVHDVPATLVLMSGKDQRGVADKPLAINDKVLVKDKYNNPVVYSNPSELDPAKRLPLEVKFEVISESNPDIPAGDTLGTLEYFKTGDTPKPQPPCAAPCRTIKVYPTYVGTAAVVHHLGTQAWTLVTDVGKQRSYYSEVSKTYHTDLIKISVDGFPTITYDNSFGYDKNGLVYSTANPDIPALVKLDGTPASSISFLIGFIPKLSADGISKVKIDVNVKDKNGNPTTGIVEMETTLGTFSPQVPSLLDPSLPNGKYEQVTYTAGVFVDPGKIAEKELIKAKLSQTTGQIIGYVANLNVILTDVMLDVNVGKDKLLANGSDSTEVIVTVWDAKDVITLQDGNTFTSPRPRENELVVVEMESGSGVITPVVPDLKRVDGVTLLDEHGAEVGPYFIPQYKCTYNAPIQGALATAKFKVYVKNAAAPAGAQVSITVLNDPFDYYAVGTSRPEKYYLDKGDPNRKVPDGVSNDAFVKTLTLNPNAMSLTVAPASPLTLPVAEVGKTPPAITLAITVTDPSGNPAPGQAVALDFVQGNPPDYGSVPLLATDKGSGKYEAVYTAGTVVDGNLTIRITVARGTSLENYTDVNIQLKASPFLTVTQTPAGGTIPAGNCTIATTVTSNISAVTGSSVTLRYRKDGKAAWETSLPLTAPPYQWTIPATIKGLAYYIEAADAFGYTASYMTKNNPVSVLVTGSITATKGKYLTPPLISGDKFKANYWYTVSLPVDGAVPDFTTDFQAYVYKGYWTALKPPLKPGEGAIILSSTDKGFTTNGTSRDITKKFSVPLNVGWNLVGNPFSFGRFWDDNTMSVKFGAQEAPITDASRNGWVYHAIWWANPDGPKSDYGGSFWDAASSDPTFPGQAVDIWPAAIGPFSGFFVLAFEKCELLFSPISYGPEDILTPPASPSAKPASAPVPFLDVRPPVPPDFTALEKEKVPFSAVYQNYPNPFNPDTWFPYQIAEEADVVINIYDVKGYLVQALHLGHKLAGFYVTREKAAHWDGKNTAGERVASGIYFYQLQAGKFESPVTRMVILK